jgi:foldase protein PrsA
MRMTSTSRLGLLIGCVALASACFTGCGGSESLVHIDGTSASISKSSLNHWMQALVSQDFRSNVGTPAPVGLVSEPANYSRCAAVVRSYARQTGSGRVKLSESAISTSCHQLYRSVKAQAMSFLISTAWTGAEAAEMGLKLSEAELKHEFARERRNSYPTETQLRKYLIERHLVLSDLLYQLKYRIFVTRILPKFQEKVKRAGGGEKTYTKLALERYHALVARTSCLSSYVAPGCREYRGPETVSPSPNAVLEGIVQ